MGKLTVKLLSSPTYVSIFLLILTLIKFNYWGECGAEETPQT